MQGKRTSSYQNSSEKDKKVLLVVNDQFHTSLMLVLDSEKPMTIGDVVAAFSSEKLGETFEALAQLHRRGQVLFWFLEGDLELMVVGYQAWDSS